MASARSNINDKDSIAIVIFGKTGNGKSSLGNTILGDVEEPFTVGSGMSSTTKVTDCKKAMDGRNITVLDVPDFTNLKNGLDRIEDKIKSVKERAKQSSARYAILLAVRCDVRYTREEYDIYKQFITIWGTNFTDHLIVAFTFCDKQDFDQQELKNVNRELKSVLRSAKDRHFVFRDTNDTEWNTGRVDNLVKTIRNETKMKTKLSKRHTHLKCAASPDKCL